MKLLQRVRVLSYAPETNPAILTLLASTFLVLAYNVTFWNRFIDVTGGMSFENIALYAASFLILVLMFNALLAVVTFRPLIKPILTIIFCINAVVVYFMTQHGVTFDAVMLQNIVETNPREATELLNSRVVLFFVLLGVVPSLVVWRTKLTFAPLRRHLLTRVGIFILSVLVGGGLTLAFYKHLAPTFRENRELQFMVTPINYIAATRSYIRRKWARSSVVAPLGTDAVKGVYWQGKERKTVTVIVLGETARGMNFSLNGYSRETNPELSKQKGLINFTNVQACGTATAVSVPCVFSSLGRSNYSDSKAKSQQGLLDVLSHAGFDVLWRNNNSGCKGVCDRIEREDMSKPVSGNPFCNSEECYDERLLDGLPERIRSAKKDLVIVLHQQGSHGPTYFKRYPEKFNRFKPGCDTSDLQKCTSEQIVATYDNTILYTDHFISETIDMLRRLERDDKIDVSLMYFSDHGESLGENGMYLHGSPYMISPNEQRHVPMMVWLSDSFRSRFQIDGTCLAARADQAFSHDNVFHSVLGMLNVKTSVHNPSLDIFQACTQGTAKL